MEKGVSTIIAAILLFLIAMSLVISFLSWSTGFVGKYKNVGNEKTEETLAKFGTSFYIYEIQGNVIRVKNNGQKTISADDLHVYVNGTLVSAVNDTSSIAPGEILNFTLSQSTDDSIVEVSGPFGKHDEVSGELITTTSTTSSTTTTSTTSSTSTSIYSDPDLYIKNVYVAGHVAIFYNIKNSGGSTAGSSTAQLYIDGSPVATDATPSLAAGAESDEVFHSYSWSCTDPSDIIRVCVDIYNVVHESNEGNNCYTSTWYCP